eukprot:CAMPEP_0197654448 /NCGR_PEP_ID=MMETSP1338-20131121/38854_1 /TAXON_ID=43686 ORGANISM="Pelagodinium beii, Strain RCC1491" /NCGR_SAMPLE_ID=MMETSP1338 /ASSEMBLY_ACC=CAM_ASM_000754 /LENGTH=121 /DNA_ID=CAMNT_0043229891 /DNA_START=155 /DNA_END=520 /DNA_ORIENTATION=+
MASANLVAIAFSSVNYDALWARIPSRPAELPDQQRLGPDMIRPLPDLETLRREAIEACSITFDEDAERCQGLRDQISLETALDALRREAVEVCSISFDDGSVEAERCLSLRSEVSRIGRER